MTTYNGNIFGFNYGMEFKTEEEFIAYIIAKLKKYSPLTIKVLNELLKETDTIQAIEAKTP